MLAWLELYPALVRLVALSGTRVVGHVALVKAGDGDPDVLAALESIGLDAAGFAESSRLFVHPEFRGRGVGRMLKRALAEHSWSLGLRPMSTVMITQTESLELNRREGWVRAGSLIGKSGLENIVFLAPEPSRLQTDIVHAGVRTNGIGAVATGIEVSTTFTMDEPGKYGEFAYARSQNPTRKALESALVVAEDGSRAMAFSSGLAAIDAVLRLLSPGDRVMIGTDAYGGTWRLLDKVWKRYGIGVDVVDLTDLGKVSSSWTAKTRMLMLETPSNPGLQVFDIKALADLAHGYGARLVVDNTFATPYLQQPLNLGADVVVHSATKYLGGHSDVVAGALVVRDDDLAKEFVFTQKAVGAVPGPFDSFLVLRGMRTLAVRVERQSATALQLARMLESHPAVSRVHYPGLVSHPQHDLAARQMRLPGGMLSVSLTGGHDAAVRLVKATEVFTLAESLGAVESLIEHPASMTHAANASSELAVDPGLVRISVGLEDVWVLAQDLRRALDSLTAG
jgi:cystathionine gamma-synthase